MLGYAITTKILHLSIYLGTYQQRLGKFQCVKPYKLKIYYMFCCFEQTIMKDFQNN